MTPVTVARDKDRSGTGEHVVEHTQDPKSSDNLLVSVSTNNIKNLNSSSATNQPSDFKNKKGQRSQLFKNENGKASEQLSSQEIYGT